jgi:hypothetical protein
MRRLVLTLALAVPPLAFAPAPFAKPERRVPETPERLAVRACGARLDALRVRWELFHYDGTDWVVFTSRDAYVRGKCPVRDGNLPGALLEVVKMIEDAEKERQ